MNRMLVVVFENEAAAEAGARGLRELHAEGSLTLYTMVVIAKGHDGKVSVKEHTDRGPVGSGVGLAVGSLVGLLGGPASLALGAVAGTLAGAVRDYWVAGVGVDFVEDASAFLQPGKVAVVAEVEEEWVIPVDTRMAAAGGVVFRRARMDMAEAQYDRDISAFKAEIAELAGEARHASDAGMATLQAKLAAAQAGLGRVEQRAKQRGEELTLEVEGKVHSLTEQIHRSQGKAKTQLEHRVARVKSSYHERSAKLGKAWGLAKEALGV